MPNALKTIRKPIPLTSLVIERDQSADASLLALRQTEAAQHRQPPPVLVNCFLVVVVAVPVPVIAVGSNSNNSGKSSSNSNNGSNGSNSRSVTVAAV
ncbi:hypothetical protein M0802_011297 [Mischocyttarus mexicanus]|nr:hypothetical protein M0802_011297 [Mischocyttarus mexicanus]